MQDPVIQWLLEPNNPSVQYFTLINLLGHPPNSLDVEGIRNQILQDKRIQKIFKHQNSDGSWGNPLTPYLPKYKATYWQIMILSQLGLDKNCPAIDRAVEYIWQYQRPDGAFAVYGIQGAESEYEILAARMQKHGKIPPKPSEKITQLLHENELTCLTGNVVSALINLGFYPDYRIDKALKWLVSVQNLDGGWLCPYWGKHRSEKHGCFMGTITPLDAFSHIPANQLSSEIQETVKRGAEFLLIHHLFKADHHNGEIINPNWLKFSFPTFFYNILRGLDVLIRLGIKNDPRMHDAIDIIKSKRSSSGTWTLDASLEGRMWSTLEKVGEPSKWITLKALSILKQLSE
jgi:hypothetical protein